MEAIAFYFLIDNMKKIWLKGSVKLLSVDYNAVDTSDILDIHSNIET